MKLRVDLVDILVRYGQSKAATLVVYWRMVPAML